MLAVFRGLYDMNEDIGGWIHIPDTGVDYPVMQYADGHYSNHNSDQEYSIYGQPYFDEHFALTHKRVHIIHGRNTGDGQMFSDLLNYRRVAYLQEHPVIEMNTLHTNARWQIFAVCVRDSRDEDRFNLQDEPKDYEDFIDSLLRRSLFRSDMTVTAEDTFLLLTVNAQKEYGFSGAQLVVAARLITDEAQAVTYRVNNRVQMPVALGGTTTTTRTTRPTTAATTVTTTTTNPTMGETTSTTMSTEISSTTAITSTTAADDIPTDDPNDDENGEDDDYTGN